jgi:putative molybdopterin biosynthesis protein
MARIVACNLEPARKARGYSQRQLAEAAGVTRQAVAAIEKGRMQPSVGIALALASALGTAVEELFVPQTSPPPPAFAGIAREYLVTEPSFDARTSVFVAGCDLAVGLLARHATLRDRERRAIWLPMTNRASLEALRDGRVQAAVVHGDDGRAANAAYERFEIAVTEEGWLLTRGNPLRVRGARDLARSELRVVNRPVGAAARTLLDAELRRARLDSRSLCGYEREVAGQLDAGRAVAQGFADVAVGTASAARTFDLDFVPLREERCVLVVKRRAARTPQVRMLLDALRSQPYRNDIHALDAYDTQRMGERIA